MKPFWRQKKCCSSGQSNQQTIKIGLVGNPNCGKSTVFNALTGACQTVGNWPGVTVDRKSGVFSVDALSVEVIDLPGIYSLIQRASDTSLDERIACQFILDQPVDAILNIVDASHLERHLYLTLQLLERGLPVIIAFNRMDIVKQRGLQIHIEQLAKTLGCPIVPIVARTGEGIDLLKQRLVQFDPQPSTKINIPYPTAIQKMISKGISLSLLEGDGLSAKYASDDFLQEVKAAQTLIQNTHQEDADILIADARYQFIQTIVKQAVHQTNAFVNAWTKRLDAIFLNRWLGIPIFLMMMYAVFFFAINVGGACQDFFDHNSHLLLVTKVAQGLSYLKAPDWVIALIANGIGKGINTVLTFIPVIGALFLGLSFLEDSGYMARAAFIMDRFMRMLGLPGKSFVPMIVGFGCNVPAVMASRTLENPRDRLLTVMMTPFMSCGARLAIYAVFITAFFKQGGQNIVFGLYLFGISMAILTGWLLRHTVLTGKPAPLVMELPSYHLPKLSGLLRHAGQRLRGFVWRAGKLIVLICIVLGLLNTLNINGTLNHGEGDQYSILSYLGRMMTPLFAPMGIHADNWPATVGLVTGILAKEVVVGTLNTLYAQMAHVGASSAYGVMAAYFQSTTSAMAYLLFVLLYFPCVSTVAVMWREVGYRWTLFSVVWTTTLAYSVAVIFYQCGRFL